MLAARAAGRASRPSTTCRLERAIARTIRSEHGLATRVTCPPASPGGGTRLDMHGASTGRRLPGHGRPDRRQGARPLRERGPLAALDMAKVERAIAASILAQRHTHATVSCPHQVLQKAGIQFRCIATVSSTGARQPFVVGEVNGYGHVALRSAVTGTVRLKLQAGGHRFDPGWLHPPVTPSDLAEKPCNDGPRRRQGITRVPTRDIDHNPAHERRLVSTARLLAVPWLDARPPRESSPRRRSRLPSRARRGNRRRLVQRDRALRHPRPYPTDPRCRCRDPPGPAPDPGAAEYEQPDSAPGSNHARDGHN